MSTVKSSPSAPLNSASSFGSNPLVDGSQVRPKTSETVVVVRTVRGSMTEARKRKAKCLSNLSNDISFKTNSTDVKHQRSPTLDKAARKPKSLCVGSDVLPPPGGRTLPGIQDVPGIQVVEASGNMRDGYDMKLGLPLSEKIGSNSNLKNNDAQKSSFASISKVHSNNMSRTIKNPQHSELTLNHQNIDNVHKEMHSKCFINACNTTVKVSCTCEASLCDTGGVEPSKDSTPDMDDAHSKKCSVVTKQKSNLSSVNKCKLQMATNKPKQTGSQNMTKNCKKIGLFSPRTSRPKVQYSQSISNLPSDFNRDESSHFLKDLEDAAREPKSQRLKLTVDDSTKSQQEDVYKDGENTRASFSDSTRVPGNVILEPSGECNNTCNGTCDSSKDTAMVDNTCESDLKSQHTKRLVLKGSKDSVLPNKLMSKICKTVVGHNGEIKSRNVGKLKHGVISKVIRKKNKKNIEEISTCTTNGSNNIKTNKIPQRGNGDGSKCSFHNEQTRSANGVYETNWTTRIPFEDVMASVNSRKIGTRDHIHNRVEERRRKLMKECYDALIGSTRQSHRHIAKLIGQEIELENELLEFDGRDQTLECSETDAAKVKENKLLQDKQNSFIAQNENTVHLRSKSDELRIKDNNNNSDLEIEEIETSMTYFCTPSIRATATSTQPRFSISNIFSDSALDDSSATSTGNVTKTTLKDTEGTKSITSLPAAPATAGACAQTCVLPSPASDSRRGRKRKSGSVVPIDIPRTKKTGNYGRISDISEEQAGCQVSGKALLKPSSLDNSVLSLNKEECSHLDNPASLYTKENNEHLKGRVNRFRVFYNSNFAQGPHSTASTNMPDNVLNSLLLESSASGNRDGVEKYPEVYLTPTENRLNEMSFTNVEELINHDANGSSLSNNIHAEKCDQEKYINRMCVPQSRIIAGARRISEPGSRDTGNCNKFVPQECSVAYAAENNIENAGNLKGRRIINDVGQSTSKEMAEVDTAISTANSDECLVVDVCTSCEFDSSVVIQDNHLHATVEADIHCVQTDNVLDNLKEKEDVVTVKIQERKSQNQDALFPAKDISEEGIDVHSCQAEIPGSSAAYSDNRPLEPLLSKSTSDSEDDDVLSIYASSWTGIDSDAEGEKDNLEYQKLIDPNEITRDLGQEQTYSGKSGKVCLDQYTTKHAKENTLDFCNDNETVCKISGDAHCTQDLSINNGTATSEISCRRNTLILGSNQSCTRNASSGLYQDKEPDKLDQISTLNLNQSLLESEEHVNVRELLHVTRESGQENRSCENGDKSIPVQYSNMTAETRAEHTESNIILTLKTNLGESLSTVDNLHIPHNSRHTMSQEKNIVTKEDNHRANIYGYLPSSPDLMTKQTDNVNVNSGLYPREGRPTGDHNSHRSLKSQKFSEKGQKYYNINIIPKPPTYNYCSRFIHQGVCYQPACLLQHEMSQELESYLAQLILHYVRSNLEREAWSLIDRHTSARQNSTLLMISLLKALARHIVEMESINLFPNIKVPSHIASPLNIAKVETLCDFHRGQDAYRLLRQCYNSASLFSAELLITIFIRYCEHCPEREAVSPWEKILLWQYEKPGNPFEEKLKDMFNFGWLKVHINARNFNRVCEVYSHLCRTLSTPSMFFTSITCSVITFFTNTGQRKRSFWVLDEVRRLKANDASIFIALIPTDKESAMCVLHELSELSQLVCELRVPLPTCTWDLLFTLMINHANFTLAVSLLICAMQISLFRPEIDVLEKILFDCYRGGPMLMQPLSNLIRALPAEYLNRMRPSLHRLLTFLTHEPPPAQHIKDIIIHQCQGYGINLFPNSDVSGYKIHSEGGTNAHSVMQCSLGVHNVDGRVAQYGTVPGERDTRHGHMASVDVSSSCHRFSSLESRRSLGAFEYQMNRIRNNENTQLTIGFGNSKDSNITKKLPENSGNFGRSFIGSSSFTTKKMSFESRCSTDSIYSQELCSRKNISRVYANQHSVASSGPRLLKNTTYSSYLNQEESSAPTGSDFPNRLMHVSTTTTRHEEQLISPAPVYHGKSYTVNTACQDLLKTQTEISSLGLHSHKRSINLSQEDLPGVPVDKRELATGNHRWRVSKKQEVDLNTQGKESEDFNVPQCQESYDHTQTNVQKKASKSVPGYSQTYKETRCQGSLSEDVAGVVSRHVSALSNSTSLGSCINSDKQEREKIPKYDKKNVYHKNGQHKLSSEQHAELCSPHGTGSVVQAQGGVLQCSSENTRLHCDSNQSGSASEFPTKQVPLSNAEPKQLCNSVRESSSKVKMTEMSSALGAQGNLATQTAEQGKASCNREHSNVQTCIQKTAMVSEAEALPSNTAIISKFKDGNYSLSCSVSHVTKQMGLLQRTVSKKCVQKKPVTVSKPCVSTTPESRDLPLPGGVMIDVEGCSYSPQAYELEGYGDELDVEHVEFAANACQSIQVNQIVRDLRMIAELNSERLKKIKLVKIFNLLTKKDDIHSVGVNLATILKSVSGKRSRVFTPAEEELIGRLGVSLMVKCIEQCYPDQALCVIQSLHHHKISFYSCMPINKENPPSEHKLAVMALDVLHQMQNLKLFTDILEEIYWSGGTEDVKLRLNMLSKVLGTCFHSLVNGSASISKETLWFIIKILASLVKYYQHDVQTISGEYNNIINLPEFLRKAWEYSQGCEDQEAHSELYRVICSSLDFGVDLSHEITHNLKHFRTDVTYQMSKSARYSEKISSPQQKMSSNAHYKGCGKTGREAHPDVSYCINDSESRNIMNSSSGPGGSTSVNTCYQDLRQAGSITGSARGAHSYSIQVTVKGDEAISNTNNTMESNSETHRTTELMGGNRGRAESRRFTTRNKRRKKLWRRPLMRTQITEW